MPLAIITTPAPPLMPPPLRHFRHCHYAIIAAIIFAIAAALLLTLLRDGCLSLPMLTLLFSPFLFAFHYATRPPLIDFQAGFSPVYAFRSHFD